MKNTIKPAAKFGSSSVAAQWVPTHQMNMPPAQAVRDTTSSVFVSIA